MNDDQLRQYYAELPYTPPTPKPSIGRRVRHATVMLVVFTAVIAFWVALAWVLYAWLK